MRVCLVCSARFPPDEGIGYHVWNLACQLRDRGHGVGIITRGKMAPTQSESTEGIALWRVPFAPLYPFHVCLHRPFVNRLLRQIEGRYDLVNAHTPLPPPVSTSLSVVTTVHSPMRADTAASRGCNVQAVALRLQTPLSQRIETRLFRQSQAITAVARWVAEALRTYGVPPTRVTITGNGVEECFFHEHPVRRPCPLVLYVGRIAPAKGLPDLVRAARCVVERFGSKDLRFAFVGQGPLVPALRHQVRRAGLQGRFQFLGQVPSSRREELALLYRRAWVFVLPSHHEGMPTALLEAMASGLPSVATSVGGAREIVVDGENGMLVPARSPEALAQALLALLADAPLRRRLGRSARRSVERAFSWDVVAERYLHCYRRVLWETR